MEIITNNVFVWTIEISTFQFSGQKLCLILGVIISKNLKKFGFLKDIISKCHNSLKNNLKSYFFETVDNSFKNFLLSLFYKDLKNFGG